jgi:hypothetical protein
MFASALVLKTSMHVCIVKTFIEQRVVTGFLTLKDPRASGIAAQL